MLRQSPPWVSSKSSTDPAHSFAVVAEGWGVPFLEFPVTFVILTRRFCVTDTISQPYS